MTFIRCVLCLCNAPSRSRTRALNKHCQTNKIREYAIFVNIFTNVHSLWLTCWRKVYPSCGAKGNITDFMWICIAQTDIQRFGNLHRTRTVLWPSSIFLSTRSSVCDALWVLCVGWIGGKSINLTNVFHVVVVCCAMHGYAVRRHDIWCTNATVGVFLFAATSTNYECQADIVSTA